MIKILVISNSNIPVPPLLYGGAQRIAHNLCLNLSKNNYEVNLLSAKDSRQYNGKTLNYLDYRFGTSLLGRCYSWAEFQIQCIRLSKNVDIIQSFVVWPERLYFLNKINKPILYTNQNTGRSDDFERIAKTNPNNGYLQCISKDQRLKVNKFDPEKTFVTYNCVDTNFFSPQNFPKENYLAYLGRLNYDKGIDIAVKLSLDSGIPLKIAGVVRKQEKEAQKFFDAKVKPFLGEQIEYVGEVDDYSKLPFLAKAKALIVPNRWDEPFGIMNIEALACGTPIVATNKGSLKEIIINNKTGFLCDNYPEMLNAVRNINFLDNAECRNDACKRFSVENYTQEIIKIHNKILKR